MHGHGAAVVVDVVAALAVGEDLAALDKAGGLGVAGASAKSVQREKQRPVLLRIQHASNPPEAGALSSWPGSEFRAALGTYRNL